MSNKEIAHKIIWWWYMKSHKHIDMAITTEMMEIGKHLEAYHTQGICIPEELKEQCSRII